MLSDQDYSRLRETLQQSVAKRCRGWLLHYQDDIVQNALLRILKKIQDNPEFFEGNAPLAASYLWKVAHSCLVDEIRRRERRLENPIDETPESDSMGSIAPGPSQQLDSKAIRQAVQGCLSEMIEDRRRALVLHMMGYTVPESAEILGWEQKRTDNCTYRGREDLRKCLEGKGITP